MTQPLGGPPRRAAPPGSAGRRARGPYGQRPLLPAAGPTSRVTGEPTTIEGEVARVTFENEDTGFRVARVVVPGEAEEQILVGVFPPAIPGSHVRATGRYEADARHGMQFRVETLLVVAPSTLDGIERYLASGMIPGIGPAYAKRIVEAFGEQTLEVLDRAGERLHEVPGLGPRRAEAVARAWTAQRAIGAIMIFLQAHGASPSLAARIFKRFGPKAIDLVSRAPYRLALEVWGVGFKTADRIARSIGVGEDAPERAQAGVLQTLHDLTDRGHVFVPRRELCELSAALLDRDALDLEPAIDALEDKQLVHVEATDSGEIAVSPSPLHDAEVRVARRIVDLLDRDGHTLKSRLVDAAPAAIAAFEERAHVTLAPAQRAAIEQAAAHKVLVITGGPGVGKTTIVRALLALFDHARLPVRLCAPTGRAAKRMSEATGREATTLHRALEFDPKRRAFQRRKGRPIEAKAIVVDEASMIDLALADALLDATADDARLVIVGDVDQLPSVGPGAVLRDIIDSNVVTTVRLTQIFRQAEGSLIVRNAHRIHDGEPPETTSSRDGEFYIFERSSPQAAAETVRELVTKRIPEGFGLDPIRDVQVLTPMHRGEAGSTALNTMLQAALNPDGAAVQRGSKLLRVGDKVMQVRNDYDREVYNGDVGIIARLDEAEKQLFVRFDDREVTYEESDLDELVLAYATSIHKSQGSEYPAVVVPILSQHFVMLARNLLYTAVTRSKRLCVLVTDARSLSLALSDQRKEQRRTRLAERLRMEAERP